MGSTIRDVAVCAGVSMSTVSRVLNDTCPVDQSKRKRVIEAVKALGYRPNPAARSLLSQKTGGLGIILPFVSGEFFSEFLNGIDRTAQQEGFFLLISTSHHSRLELAAALAGMNQRVDGLLVMAPQIGVDEEVFSATSESPTVFVNTPSSGQSADSITFDNFGGMYTVTAHLLSRGHRKIGIISGPADSHDAKERMRGYQNAMRDTGVTPNDGWIIHGDYTQKGGYDAVKELLKQKEKPTAVLCSNDYAAIGALIALHEAGLSVPDDMAVTGFDDVPSARYSHPSLTTVHVPVKELGATAARLLISRINDPTPAPHE